MKQFVIAFLLLSAIVRSDAQVGINSDLERNYRDFVQQTRSGFKTKELSDFASLGGSKRFFSSDWETGTVNTGYGVTISTNYKFNYDFLDNELYALFNDTAIAVDQNYIASFYLRKNEVAHFFLKIPSIDNGIFFESIGYDSAKKYTIQLVKSRIATVVKGDKNSYLANFNGDYADNIKVKSDYYLVFPDGKFTRVKLDKKSLSAALTDYSNKTASFFEGVKEINEVNVGKLLVLVNL